MAFSCFQKTNSRRAVARQKAVICGKFVQFKQLLVVIKFKDLSSAIQGIWTNSQRSILGRSVV